MAFFNVVIGLIIGIILMIPLGFVKQNWAKGSIAIIALLGAFLGTMLSQQYLYPPYLLWRFEKAVQDQPVFQLIAKHHPKEYEAYLKKIRHAFHQKEDVALVTTNTAELVNRIFQIHLEKAPNDPIDLYLKSTIELYRYLYTKMPEAVVMMETGRGTPSVNVEALGEDLTFSALLTRLLDAKKLVIQESIKSPVEYTDFAQAKASLDKIYNNLAKKFSPEIIQTVFVPSGIPVPPRISSIVILEFYEEILSAGKGSSGEIMRYVASKSAKPTN